MKSEIPHTFYTFASYRFLLSALPPPQQPQPQPPLLIVPSAQGTTSQIEHLLTKGLSIYQSGCSKEISEITYWLNPFHHLSLNAYTTLASAYKVLADDLYSEIDNHLLKAFDRSRSSAAYSLLLACAAHHLFVSESFLVLYIANFWTSAGESLLNLARSSVWSEFVRCNLAGSDDSDLYPIEKHKCPECSLIDKFENDSFYDQVTHPVLEHVSIEFIDCVTNLTQKVWNFLVQGCPYLSRYNNPFDFCWVDSSIHDVEEVLASPCGIRGNSNCGNRRSISGSEEDDPNQLRIYIIKLGVHCLLYGKCLSRKCYGGHFYLSSPVHNTSN